MRMQKASNSVFETWDICDLMIKKILLLFIGLTLFGFYLFKVWNGISLSSLTLIDGRWLLVIVVLNLVSILLKAFRWHYLLTYHGITLRKRELFSSVAAGFFLGLVTPGTSGEVGRLITVNVRKSVGFTTVIFEKVFDLAVIFLVILLGLVAYMLDGYYDLFVISVISIAIVLLLYFLPVWGTSILTKVIAVFEKIKIFSNWNGRVFATPLQQLHQLCCSSKLVLFSFAVSVILLLVSGIQFAIICHLLKIPSSAEMVILAFFLPYLAGILSLIPMSLGILEFTSSSILSSFFGIPMDIGNMTVLIYRMSVTIPLVLLGFLCYGIRVLLRRNSTEQVQLKSVRLSEGRFADKEN